MTVSLVQPLGYADTPVLNVRVPRDLWDRIQRYKATLEGDFDGA
jgi:hypothetical protein